MCACTLYYRASIESQGRLIGSQRLTRFKEEAIMRSLKIIMLSSAFNGLTQRAWLELRQAGHSPSVVLFTDENAVCELIEHSGADLVICPFLKDRVPQQLWSNPKRPLVIIHPGIIGDRGASALDWAITHELDRWGVTALQAVEEMDAGPVWATSEFNLPQGLRKSELYNGRVSDAAIRCIREVVDKFIAGYVPVSVDYSQHQVLGRLQPNMKQADRTFSWHDCSRFIKRSIDAADGQPGCWPVWPAVSTTCMTHISILVPARRGRFWRCMTTRYWWQPVITACGSARCGVNRCPVKKPSSARPGMCSVGS